MQDALILKLENEIKLKQKCMHYPNFRKLDRQVPVILLQEIRALKMQLKLLKQQKIKTIKRKYISE